MTSSISDRMKRYERAADIHFTPNSPVVIRVDGKAFHSFLRHADRPFDEDFMSAMRNATKETAEDMHGFKLAYTQSDEATFVITDYDRHETQGWFGYSLNKVVSVATSMFTAYFNREYENPIAWESAANAGKLPPVGIFDGRAFVIPVADLPNVFVWRQRDWERNSVQMLARAHFSHKQCANKKIPDLHEMLNSKGIDWGALPMEQRHGTFVTRDGSFLYGKLSYDQIAALIEPRKEEDEGEAVITNPVFGI